MGGRHDAVSCARFIMLVLASNKTSRKVAGHAEGHGPRIDGDLRERTRVVDVA